MVKDYATDLGYEYLAAGSKEEFSSVVGRFLTPEVTDKPMLLEVFTETDDESNALEQALNLIVDPRQKVKQAIKNKAKGLLGENGVNLVKRVVKR